MRIILLAFLMVITTKAAAENALCSKNLIDFNICDAAKRIRDDIAPSLPQKISANLVFRSISSFDNSLSLYAMLLYERDTLKNAAASAGVSMGDIEAQMYLTTKNYVCTSPALEAFINLGGELSYIYQFQNGKLLYNFKIGPC